MSAADRYFTQPGQFEPLLPERRRGELASQAASVIERSIALTGAAHSTTIDTLRGLLREMNSYYSNRIEGQSTHPLAIAQALRSEYSEREPTAQLQRLALAHIQAEQILEGPPTKDVLTIDFLRRTHSTIYAGLPEHDRVTSRGTLLDPGQFRTDRVVVGRHVPPEADSLTVFGRRFDVVYGARFSLDQTLVSVAAAHQRASWIHPFEDGNGRAIRLQTHCALFPYSRGLWSISRGLARNRESYYAYLASADSPRAGDLDGRGNLSDAALASWCEWFIDLCRDQIDFMSKLLDLDRVQRRISALITSRSADDPRYRMETIMPIFHLFATGPMSRGDFLRMTGLGERTARSALAHLIGVGLITSRDHRSAVRIAFPLDALQMLFPDLYPEASTVYSDG